MSSVGGTKILLYVLLGPCFGSLLVLANRFVFRSESGLLLNRQMDSLFIGLIIALFPFLLIALSIAVFDAFLKRVPAYVPFLSSIIPFLVVWGFEIHMLGDPPKDYLGDFPDALFITVVPAMIVWLVVRMVWGDATK
jgi:hypothetical protein